MTQDKFAFVSDKQMTDAELAAAERSGSLKFWRRDAAGVRWFLRRNCGLIVGVPDDEKLIAG